MRWLKTSPILLRTHKLPWLLASLAWFLSGAASANATASISLALTDVNVIPMTDSRVLPNQTVLIAEGRIIAIGSDGTIKIPAGTEIIEAEGGFLIPGLAEMHAHIPAGDTADLDDVLTLYLTQGITTIRGMLGRPAHLDLRRRAAANEVFAPNIFTSGPSFNGNSVDSPEQARNMVRAQQAAGYDLLKLHPGLKREEFDAIVEVARQLDMPFAGHVSVDVGLARALEVNQNSIDHLDDYIRALIPSDNPILETEPQFFGINMATYADVELIPELAARTAEAGVWSVPTETLMVNLAGSETVESLSARPEIRYVSGSTLSQWQRTKRQFEAQADQPSRTAFLDVRRQMLKALHDANAGILLGSDAPQIFNVPGFSLHRELKLMVDAGLTPYAALRTGTVNVATYFGLENSGEIRPGYAADLVLLEANPLEDITRTSDIKGVMIRGTWHGKDKLNERLEAIALRHKQTQG